MARSFNESLRIIEDQQKKSKTGPRRMATVQPLPPINESGLMSATATHRAFFPSRPVSAVTSRSFDSKGGNLYSLILILGLDMHSRAGEPCCKVPTDHEAKVAAVQR